METTGIVGSVVLADVEGGSDWGTGTQFWDRGTEEKRGEEE